MNRILLAATAGILLGLLGVADRQLELYRHPSGRYRAHAIPVALSQVYHGRVHDYTAFPSIAAAVRERPLDDVIALYSNPATPVGGGTYFWTADDRGLSDYVNIAFRLFGPRSTSLALLYYTLLGLSLFVFVLAEWRRPLALFAPIFILLGLIAYAYACSHYMAIVLGDGQPWQEAITLYDARAFESIAVLAWLQIALLVWQREPAGRADWLAAVPQILLLVFLYHARSSLGWMYLALFAVIAVRFVTMARRPLIVLSVVIGSLIGLQLYTRVLYHPAYFEDRGTRSVWHNALMGLGYNPQLRKAYDVGIDDTKVIELVVREMRRRNDARLTPDWKLDNIGGALGGAIQFDWRLYEQAARDTYFGVWRREPVQTFLVYAWYKPVDLAHHTWLAVQLVGGDLRAGRANPLAAALALAGGLLVIGGFTVRSDPTARKQVRTLFALSLCLLAFSTIPALAFYTALPTVSAFHAALPLCLGLLALCLVPTLKHGG